MSLALKSRSLLLLILLGPTGLLVLYNTMLVVAHPVMPSGDEISYHALAIGILSGDGFIALDGSPTAWRTPGFPTFLAAIYGTCGISPLNARIVLVVVTGLTAPLVYFLGKVLFKDDAVAVASGVIWISFSNTFKLSSVLVGENVSAALMVLSCICIVVSHQKPSVKLVIVAGVFAGAAILTRGYLLLAPIGPSIWIARKNKAFAAVFLLSCMVLPGSWAMRNAVELGSPVLSTQPAQEMWCGNNAWARGAWPGEWTSPNSQQKAYIKSRHPGFDEMSELNRSRVFANEFVIEVCSHPVRIFWLIPRKVAVYLSPASSHLGMDWMYLCTAPFSILGIMLFLRKGSRYRNVLWIICAPLISVAAVCMLTFGDSRFRQPVNPFIALLSGYAIVGILRRCKCAWRERIERNGIKTA